MAKKVIAFAASSSSRSINRRLVTWASSLLDGAEVEILDLNDYELPLFSVDREDELGQPELARAFLDKITGSDGIIISFAEHNGAYSAAYKNLYDWVSRIQPKVYLGKPMVLLSTSPGGRGGKSVMDLALSQIPRFGGEIRASVSVPSFGDNFDTDAGKISNPEIAAQIEAAVNSLFAE
ncbi:MAG TPA: NAD(P)H-dependent oxidoreductase [Gammaproteobacteria bacterium]|nr:NAD(P)H-dependent oxidoreductase [Gammaproteobacteria bacterium]